MHFDLIGAEICRRRGTDWGTCRSIDDLLYAPPIDSMSTVKVSPKFQVVIPRDVREPMRLKPGQEVEVVRYDNRIELVPIKPMQEMRGFLPDIGEPFQREPDREL